MLSIANNWSFLSMEFLNRGTDSLGEHPSWPLYTAGFWGPRNRCNEEARAVCLTMSNQVLRLWLRKLHVFYQPPHKCNRLRCQPLCDGNLTHFVSVSRSLRQAWQTESCLHTKWLQISAARNRVWFLAHPPRPPQIPFVPPSSSHVTVWWSFHPLHMVSGKKQKCQSMHKHQTPLSGGRDFPSAHHRYPQLNSGLPERTRFKEEREKVLLTTFSEY